MGRHARLRLGHQLPRGLLILFMHIVPSTTPRACPLRVEIFSPSGGKVGENPGTRVKVDGLNYDVMEDDIQELFSGVGELLKCEVRRLLATAVRCFVINCIKSVDRRIFKREIRMSRLF